MQNHTLNGISRDFRISVYFLEVRDDVCASLRIVDASDPK
jgi:hypothetical protein